MFFYLYQTAKVANNSLQHYRSISNVICLLALEFGEAEVIVEIAGFVFGLQVAILFRFSSGSLHGCINLFTVHFSTSDLISTTSLVCVQILTLIVSPFVKLYYLISPRLLSFFAFGLSNFS